MSRYQSVYERAVNVGRERLRLMGAPVGEQERELLLAQIRVGSGCSARTAQGVLKDLLLVEPKAPHQKKIPEAIQ